MKTLSARAGFPALAVAFCVLAPLAAHLLFSPLGYNPTDDGFNLAASRRIADGQIPHRDFITIRPALSPVLHVPVVVLGGERAYMASRGVVWFQWACIAWIWSALAGRRDRNAVEKVCIALVAMASSVQIFPIMSWQTVDGLFLISLGMALRTAEKRALAWGAWFLIGAAYLCKQNFVFVLPFLLVITGDWRKAANWLAGLLPGIAYVAFLWATGAWSDALLQLTSHQQNFLSVGLYPYWKALPGVLAGCGAALWISRGPSGTPRHEGGRVWLGLLILAVVPLAGVGATLVAGRFIKTLGFVLFGLVAGWMVRLPVPSEGKPANEFRVALAALVVAWASALSIGYNSPALMSGPLLAVLLSSISPLLREKLPSGRARTAIWIAAAALILVSFGVARTQTIYRENRAGLLARKLDGILPGGRGIRTNENTYNFLADLRRATCRARDAGVAFAVLPDCPGWWVREKQPNPLSIDWVHEWELNSPPLFGRLAADLERHRGDNWVIVPKVAVPLLAAGIHSHNDPYIEFVRERFEKIDETDFLEIYR